MGKREPRMVNMVHILSAAGQHPGHTKAARSPSLRAAFENPPAERRAT